MCNNLIIILLTAHITMLVVECQAIIYAHHDVRCNRVLIVEN